MIFKSALRTIRLSVRIVFLCLFLCHSFRVEAQTYFFDNYSVEDNLANSKIYTLIQDKDHQIWLGTPSGVSKFDGSTFHNYTSDDGLAEKGVWTIYQDSHGNIWFGHFDGGISRYDGKKFEKVSLNIMENRDIFSFCENNKGGLWVTSEGAGAALISNPNDPLTKLKYEHYKGKRISDRVYGAVRFSDNKNYFVTDAGVKVFNPAKNTFDNFSIKDMPLFFQTTCLFEDNHKDLWVGTDKGGLYHYIQKEKRFVIYDIRDGLSSNTIISITQDHKGRIWVGTIGGITIFDEGIKKVFNTKNGLKNNIIYCLREDAEGNMLIATAGSGLYIYKGDFRLFTDPNVLPSLEINSILEDSKHNIWFGTSAGISVYDPAMPEKKQFTEYKGEGLNMPSQVWYLREDKNQNVWIGTEEGILLYNLNRKHFESPLFNINLPTQKKITALEIDQFKCLWIGTMDGLFYYNTSTGYLNRLSQENGLAGFNISSIYIDKNNKKYIGIRSNGITTFTDTMARDAIRIPLLGGTTPKCITSDDSGGLWIGTEGQGLLRLKDGNISKRYQETDGLLSNTINLVVSDAKGNICVGTNRGLNQIDIHSGNIKTYTKRNGFIGIQANNNAVYKNAKGTLWFGTTKGAIQIEPESFVTTANEPFTQIKQLQVNNIEKSLAQGISLKYSENHISIDYSSICLNNPDAVQYKIWLVGINRDWQQTSQPSVTYQALAPGKYIFKVIAKNSAGIWNSKPVTFEFQINPPFYQTWWFISICITIGLIILVVYIKVRETNLIKEKQVLEKKVQERTAEVVKVNNELAMKNKDIMDSILYAKRIQGALLPPKLPIENSFVLFRPKDIVSGDFYWHMNEGDIELLAAVDCTGHGVPGAFMSIIGFNALNKIVKELYIKKPSEILNQLDKEVSKTLHQYQRGYQIPDGMDITLIGFNRKTRILEYSGAFNPLWIVRDNEMIEIRANRFAIGFSPDSEAKAFTNHEFAVEPGDTVYLFSDGYADQFGGENGKKLKVAAFKELIMKIQPKTMEEQKNAMEEYFENWKGKLGQIDDVMVLGWRL
jgi:ligand-binding sensor domain-containing protein/serine phosphatase RsbU (regulator of sigma subunit)